MHVTAEKDFYRDAIALVYVDRLAVHRAQGLTERSEGDANEYFGLRGRRISAELNAYCRF